jgi:SAM-dependent methyltransferase
MRASAAAQGRTGKRQMATADATSTHYLGTDGERYFNWQRAYGQFGGIANSKHFQPYIKEGDCVLDFGCGGGYLLSAIPCRRRIGIEINPAARAVAQGNGIECYADIAELPNTPVDVAISNHALEHVPAPIATLSALHRTIKPGGLLVMKLPIDDWRTQCKVDADDNNHHLYTWTPQLLFNCLTEAGFDKRGIQIRVHTHAWFPRAAQAYSRIPEGLFDILCRGYAALRRRRQLIAVAVKASQ